MYGCIIMKEAAPNETVTVWSLISDLTNNTNKQISHAGYYRLSKTNSSDIFQWTPAHRHNNIGRLAKTCIY